MRSCYGTIRYANPEVDEGRTPVTEIVDSIRRFLFELVFPGSYNGSNAVPVRWICFHGELGQAHSDREQMQEESLRFGHTKCGKYTSGTESVLIPSHCAVPGNARDPYRGLPAPGKSNSSKEDPVD